MIDQDIYTLTAEEFSALPKSRQVEIAATLLKRGDMAAIEALGIKTMTADEFEAEERPPDVIEITSLN